jgi:hypothetical protein
MPEKATERACESANVAVITKCNVSGMDETNYEH